MKEQEVKKKQQGPLLPKSPIDRWPRQIATLLTRQSERLTRREKKVMLVVFGLLAAAASTALVVSPVFRASSDEGAWHIQSNSVTTPLVELPPVPDQTEASTARSPALRALDSLYARDPKRFIQIIEQRLAKQDSLRNIR
ncbi:hypothetical protein [Parachryseolinea silvisoli]|uniref:hypothetical protein n=1 Tax=Parachryseolinea silvisoli TaxID=2873601 RepID=UPI002265941B|nr:hypothetical protein [Parachryseolinea silvisoli]MCD9015233.1 hypothetical protein [Parachryseolinea silvisoli]